MMRTLENFPYKNVLVLGLARSGSAIARLLLASKLNVTINDQNEEVTKDIEEFKNAGARLVLGSHPTSVLDGIQLIVKNPGIPYSHQLLNLAIKRNIPIVTDIELVQYVFAGSITAITGSNGKTTTTRLVEEMLTAGNIKNTIAGNIGIPVGEVAPFIPEEDILVLELSSFQLLGIERFKPQVSVLLNLYDAHLDYHGSRENYEEAKYKIFQNQEESDYLIYNFDDHNIRRAVKGSRAKLIPISQKEVLKDGVWLRDQRIFYKDEKIIDQEKIVLAGDHHLENILAAIAVAKLHRVSNQAIEETLTSFRGVEHRLQFVGEVKGRLFYNDSKATNILATSKALEAFDQPMILLAGGLDRGDDFKALRPYLKKVKYMVVFGENANKLEKIAKELTIPVKRLENVKKATKFAYQQSEEGDIILLSPASASWDQFKSFEERGDMFTDTVHKLVLRG